MVGAIFFPVMSLRNPFASTVTLAPVSTFKLPTSLDKAMLVDCRR